MNRSRHAILVPLFAVLALLCCLTENASAAFNHAATEPHYGNFLLRESEVSTSEWLQLADPIKENGEWIYDGALGVPVYVRQNPWTFFDPLGLTAEEAQKIADTVDAKVRELGFIGKVASWVGADKALKSSLTTANERMNAADAAGKGRTLTTGEYVGGMVEGSAPAITIAVMAPAAAAGPLALAKEGLAEATGLPIGIDDVAKLAKNAPDLVQSARKIVQGTDEAVEAAAKTTVPHRNSLDYEGDTHVYAVRNPDGTVNKIGESAQGVRTGDGASKRAEQQVRKLNRETGPGHTSEIRKEFSTKKDARKYETNLIERFRRRFGEDKLEGNKTNR